MSDIEIEYQNSSVSEDNDDKPKKEKDFQSNKIKKEKKKLKLFHDVKLSKIKNKAKRLELVKKQKSIKNKLKNEKKKLDSENGIDNKIKPLTTDDKREIKKDFILHKNEDLDLEEEMDEFESFIKNEKKSKILITTSMKPSRKIYKLLRDIKYMFPNSFYYPRKSLTLNEIIKAMPKRNFTHLLMISEHNKKPRKLRLYFLPEGPYIEFRILKTRTSDKIINKARPTDHHPELILKNFNTALGRRLGRSIASFFPQNPEFEARNVTTFINKRDFIFIRNHRYQFNEELNKVYLQEIGPRISLQWLKLSKNYNDEDIEWRYKAEYYVSRSNFFI